MIKALNNMSKPLRRLAFVIYDMLAIVFSMYMALITRFEFRFSNVEASAKLAAHNYAWINVLVTLVIFAAFRLYSSLWQYASVQELISVIMACSLATLAQIAGLTMLDMRMPRSYHVLFFFFLVTLTAFSRFSYRGLRIIRNNVQGDFSKTVIPTMVIGAGDSASYLIKDIRSSRLIKNRVKCVIDADPKKIGSSILGAPIVGNDTKIPWAVEKYHIREIFIAIPNLPPSRRKAILDICKNTGCKLRILPSMAQIINEKVKVSALRDVEIVDLLGRDQVSINIDDVIGYIKDRVVMVTGGGGSIGSELCRQIAAHNPKKLIIFDIYENTTYDLQLELRRNFPNLDLEALIGSVRNVNRVNSIFEQYKPEIVFHAAAHKHVPLMEDSPNEAIKNNVFGTYNVAKAAAMYGTKKMVLISTDKAVNPTNIMGASKRICEMVIQSMEREYPDTSYVAVRFGNVLGSNGSVIPLFKKQIAAGGPVTVTDKNIIRYFMTIPEAVSLVLQAGAYAKGGEIFVLDMGEPVKIDDLARNLIKLSGYEPDVDIPIVYTGLRPGEKLYEECLKAEEGLTKTDNNLIFIGKPLEFDEKKFFKALHELHDAAAAETDDMRHMVKAIVPSYVIKEDVK
ncbi:MAG: polysaccharide biosynthesis protein [Lachnospiraceae bacterium]|nr:polysaccharide biosynthesis protein [Lachnospiraceae bacterium]